jgi:HemY protein
MIKKIIFLVSILFLAIVLGLVIKSNQGYVWISYQHWLIQSPLWFVVLLLFLVFVVLYFVLRVVGVVSNIGQYYREWHNHYLLRKSNDELKKGILKLGKGCYRRAEKILIRSSKHSHIPIIHYLAAAYAAERQKKYTERDEYLYEAYQCEPGEEFVISLIQAQFKFYNQQYDSALIILNRLRDILKKHPYVLECLKNIYLALEDWDGLLKILPQLHRHAMMDHDDILKLEHRVYLQLLSRESHVLKSLEVLWKEVPKELRRDHEIVYVYCKQLLRFKKDEKAMQVIIDCLNKSWHTSLVRLYGFVQSKDPQQQFNIAEAWLKQHVLDASLFLTLGRLASQTKSWVKAEEYLKSSLDIKKQAETYALLGYIYEKNNNIPQACAMYRLSLRFNKD